MKDLLDKAKKELESGMKLVRKKIGDMPIFVSLERSESNAVQYDEKHYFIIPYHLSEHRFSLHTMRHLPDNALEANDLPKRRIFHFPNEHYEGTLRSYMVNAARDMSYQSNASNKSTLEKLADDIDALDNKLTYGMLFIGGIAAFINPLVGAGIAIKAVLPSVTGTLTKYGLKPLGEKATRSQIEKNVLDAERKVLEQFSESTTLKVINPILNELEFALRTDESQHDPLNDPNLASASIMELEGEKWRDLTEIAIYHVYKDVIADSTQHEKANLGPEDIRWLQVLLAGKL